MTRNFYSFAIFLSAIYAIITLIHGIIYFLLGQQTFALGSFIYWYLFVSALSLLGTLVFLKYFQFKKYHLAFWSTVAGAVTGLFQFIIVCGLFVGIGELMTYYMLAHLLVVGTGILYGLALLFSETGKMYWLKLTGIFTLAFGVVVMAAAIWYINSTSGVKLLTFEQIHKWASLVACISPGLLMMNFLSEKKQLRQEDEDSMPSKTLEGVMTIVRLVSSMALLFFVLKLAGETISKVSWERQLVIKEQEWEKVSGSRTFVSSKGETLKYQLFKPVDFDPQKKYPMVVCLPYSGGVEGAPPAKLLLTETNKKKYPSFIFVPFCPNGSGWGGIPNYPTMDKMVFESIEALEKEFKEIDMDRIYVSGVSRGGYGSWNFISLRPDMFAAAAPVCGGGDPNFAPNIVDVAVWAFHGENDRNVPVSGSRNMVEAIKKSGGDPKYTEFSGAGHDIWDYVTKEPGFLDWLFEQKRDDDVAAN